MDGGPASDLPNFLRVDVRCGDCGPQRSFHRGFDRHGNPVFDNRTDCEVQSAPGPGNWQDLEPRSCCDYHGLPRGGDIICLLGDQSLGMLSRLSNSPKWKLTYAGYIGEIFPTKIHEFGIATGAASQWPYNLFPSQKTPHAIANIGWRTFLMFCMFFSKR